MSNELSEALVSRVKELEGFSAKAFGDYKQISIGYGTRAKSRDEVLTRDQADRRLREELAVHAANVDEAAAEKGLQLTEGQRNALISFDFNTGHGRFLISTSASVEEIRRRLPTWNKVTVQGKLVIDQGLVNRRKAELEIFSA